MRTIDFIASLINHVPHQKMILCLMGPTASGKTQLAIELVKRWPFEIISVDAFMVYRGMDIGTAKPDAATLKIAPHRLINLLDPVEHYSVGQFCQDVVFEIEAVLSQGKIPLLVGGSMMYFYALREGLSCLPKRDQRIRDQLKALANEKGVEALHTQLAVTDPITAAHIARQDYKRIERALEVYYLTGRPMSALQANRQAIFSNYHVTTVALAPSNRALLYARIEARLEEMLQRGLVEEVRALYVRGDLTIAHPAIQAVGYQQIWRLLMGEYDVSTMRYKTLVATRQLAKRQLTWLRSFKDISSVL